MRLCHKRTAPQKLDIKLLECSLQRGAKREIRTEIAALQKQANETRKQIEDAEGWKNRI